MPHGDITHTEIPTDDVARATAFYAGVFGWEIAEMPGFEGYPMWQAPNKLSGGALVGRSNTHGTPVSYVEVDSIDETLAKIASFGGDTVVPKSQITETSWYALFRDSEGNTLGLYEGTMDAG